MKVKVKATGEIINVRKVITNIGDELYEPLRLEWSNVKFKASDLDFLPEKETAVLEGWIARNKTNRLQFYPRLPRRANRTDEWVIDCVTPSPVSFKKLGLSDSLFPSVTWQSEPKRVRIKIEEIEE